MDAKMRTFLVFVLTFVSCLFIASATPTGPESINVTYNDTDADAANGTIVNISGGYIAGLNITAISQNIRWKAFAGWISGSYTLSDSSGSTVYDWSISSLGGEVYASTSNSITWGSIGCASEANITAEDVIMEHTGADDINATFNDTNTETFTVATIPITASACRSTHTYVNNETPAGTEFEEVILYDSANIVYATILQEDQTGYDGGTYDFQMIVPENGNASKTITTAYYLYAEIN